MQRVVLLQLLHYTQNAWTSFRRATPNPIRRRNCDCSSALAVPALTGRQVHHHAGLMQQDPLPATRRTQRRDASALLLLPQHIEIPPCMLVPLYIPPIQPAPRSQQKPTPRRRKFLPRTTRCAARCEPCEPADDDLPDPPGPLPRHESRTQRA